MVPPCVQKRSVPDGEVCISPEEGRENADGERADDGGHEEGNGQAKAQGQEEVSSVLVPKRRTSSRIPKATMAWLLRTQQVCQVCGTTEDLTGDHIISIGQGGQNVRTNTQLLCRACNGRKGRVEDRADRR